MNRSNRVGRLGVLVAALFAVVALAGPTSAFAQSVGPKDVEYNPPVLQVNTGGSPEDPAVSASSSGALPFTGLDLAAFAAIGIGLVATGVVIRRVSKPRQQL